MVWECWKEVTITMEVTIMDMDMVMMITTRRLTTRRPTTTMRINHQGKLLKLGGKN